MDIIISNASDKPIYQQITEQIKQLILSGALVEGDALPSMRLLAKELRISVITTKRAYDDLSGTASSPRCRARGSFVAGAKYRVDPRRHLRRIEQLQQAAELARQSSVPLEELQQILAMLYEGE